MRDGAVLDGRYRIEQKLAAGGFGAIYRATDLIMGREVALKVLHSELADDSSVVERFRREAGALARLRDPHTITMYDVGFSADGTRYIVMELLRGESLYTLFTTKGRLPWQRVVAIARGVCSSLREAHAFQIVHRDLKPANIHLERHALEHDYVKVLDFGIAKVLESSDVQQESLTLAGQLIGTFDYMSPEQMLGGSCTGRSDVFALAVIVYEMITGVRPYGADAKGPASMLMALLGTEPVLLSTHVDVPPALDRVIMQALAQDPKERLDIDALDDRFARILDEARDLALGTMDVPLAASTPALPATPASAHDRDANDRDAAEAWFRDDDEMTWIDQVPRRDTPTTIPTLIGTPPPELLKHAKPARIMQSERTNAVATAKTVQQDSATPHDAQPMRRTPLRGTPPMGPSRAATPGRGIDSPPSSSHGASAPSSGSSPSTARVTPARGTTPLPQRGIKTSASSSEDFTRVETPRGLASGTSRPVSKPIAAPMSPTDSIGQAIAEEIDQAVDAMVARSPSANDTEQPPSSHGPQVLLPRPGSHAGIWPAPERVRPLTVRFAVGSGTELPSLETARSVGAAPISPPAPVISSHGSQVASALTSAAAPVRRGLPTPLRYVLWAAALFTVGFAIALATGS